MVSIQYFIRQYMHERFSSYYYYFSSLKFTFTLHSNIINKNEQTLEGSVSMKYSMYLCMIVCNMYAILIEEAIVNFNFCLKFE